MAKGFWKFITLALLITCCYLAYFKCNWLTQDFQLKYSNYKTVARSEVARLLNGNWENSDLKTCEFDNSILVGELKPIYLKTKIKVLEEQLPFVFPGGKWRPRHCRARKSVAIVIAYRNRYDNLLILLRALHPILKRQQLDYQIFVAEQWDEFPFNKGKINNAAFLEVEKLGSFDCIVFQDVDFVPLDDRNMYDCPTSPRHMSPSSGLNDFRCLKWFGGVNSITPAHLRQCNGWPNKYFGWGAEDDDYGVRLALSNLTVTRADCRIGTYGHSPHERAEWNDKMHDRRKETYNFRNDGLNNIHYLHVETVKENLYTHIKINIAMTQEEKNLTTVNKGDI